MVQMTLMVVLLVSHQVAAATVSTEDPLWNRAADSVARAEGAVPSRVVTHTDVFDGSGKKMESREEIQLLTGWDGGKPVFKSETKKDVIKKSGVTVSIEIGSTSNPFYASRKGLVTYSRIAEETLDGKTCVAFRFEERPAPDAEKKEEPFVGTAWVERETSVPIKVEYRPKRLPSHTSAYILTVFFQALPDGSAVPYEAKLNMEGGLLFIKRVIRLQKTLSDWTTAPGEVK